MIYKSGKITVRSITEADQQLLADWLSNPEVLQYYEGRDRPHDLEMVREHFYLEDDETRCIVVITSYSIHYTKLYDIPRRREAGWRTTDRYRHPCARFDAVDDG